MSKQRRGVYTGKWSEDELNAAVITGQHPQTGRDLGIEDIKSIGITLAWRAAIQRGDPNATKALVRLKKERLREKLKQRGKLRKGPASHCKPFLQRSWFM
jgi:hypothetical protein